MFKKDSETGLSRFDTIILSKKFFYPFMLIMLTIIFSLSYYVWYLLKETEKPVLLNEIKQELEIPSSLKLNKYNMTNFTVTNVEMIEKGSKYYSTVHGFYGYDDLNDWGYIYLNDIKSSESLNSTFIHEYSHHLMHTYPNDLPYLSTLKGKQEEQATDILAYYLSLEKDISFHPHYLFKPFIKYQYHHNSELKEDIDTLVDYEQHYVPKTVIYDIVL